MAHDWVALVYLGTFAVSLWIAPTAPFALRLNATALFACQALVISAARAFREPPAALALVYRLSFVAMVLGSYLMLGAALPHLSPHSLDAQLYRLDMALFGMEPAARLEALVSPALTEWFALFYLSYFALLVGFMAPVAAAARESRFARELVMGLVAIYAVGQTLYVLIPGYGPWYAMPEIFTRPLEGGFFFERMQALVRKAGAQKDIFPSVHTAVVVFFSILAFRHRSGRVLRVLWPLVVFAAFNVVIATLYLRWHYVVDVVAGFALALGAHVAAVRVAHREAGRLRAGHTAAWPSLR